MRKLVPVASLPPLPPPNRSVLFLIIQVVLFGLFFHPAPQANATLASVAKNSSWAPPVSGATELDRLRPFERPDMPWSSAHRGIDIRSEDQQIVAPASGEIMFVGFVVDRPVLTIKHANGLLSSFEPVESELAVGTHVSQGEVIGSLADDVQHCQQPCVHWGVRQPDGWQVGTTRRDLYLDPGFLLGWTEPSVLWPVYSDPAG